MFNAEMRLRQVMFITRRVPCTIAKAKGNAGSVHSQYDFKLMREEGSILFLENDFAEKVELLGEAVVGGATEIASVIVDELSKAREDLEFRTDDESVQYVIEVVVFYMHLADRCITSITRGNLPQIAIF